MDVAAIPGWIVRIAHVSYCGRRNRLADCATREQILEDYPSLEAEDSAAVYEPHRSFDHIGFRLIAEEVA
jgi:hypothetical protein